MVSQMAPKTKITVKALRDGKEKVFNVTLGTHPDDISSKSRDEDSNSSRVDSKYEQLDGVEVGDLDNRLRRQLDIPERINGAVVTKVDPESKAAEAGLREGDGILEINREPVKDAETAVKLSEKATGERVLLRVYSQENGQGGTRYLHVQAGKKK
jgi:serine protease Do